MKKDLNKLSFDELQKEVENLAKQKKQITTKTLKDCPLVIGENYLIRTITMIYTGKLTKVFNKELVVIDCAWIADTGRWADAVKSGNFDEVEPYPDDEEVILNREAILDIIKVKWQLPRSQK